MSTPHHLQIDNFGTRSYLTYSLSEHNMGSVQPGSVNGTDEKLKQRDEHCQNRWYHMTVLTSWWCDLDSPEIHLFRDQHWPWKEFPYPHAWAQSFHPRISLRRWIFLKNYRRLMMRAQQISRQITSTIYVPPVPLWLVKSPPWHMNEGITLRRAKSIWNWLLWERSSTNQTFREIKVTKRTCGSWNPGIHIPSHRCTKHAKEYSINSDVSAKTKSWTRKEKYSDNNLRSSRQSWVRHRREVQRWFFQHLHRQLPYQSTLKHEENNIKVLRSLNRLEHRIESCNRPLGFPAIIETEERENALVPAWRKAVLAFGANAEAVARNADEIMMTAFIVIVISWISSLTLRIQKARFQDFRLCRWSKHLFSRAHHRAVLVAPFAYRY
jgi:hypothetical protein